MEFTSLYYSHIHLSLYSYTFVLDESQKQMFKL